MTFAAGPPPPPGVVTVPASITITKDANPVRQARPLAGLEVRTPVAFTSISTDART